MDLISILLWAGLVIIIGLCYGTYCNGHFGRNGVKMLPALPFIGHLKNIIMQSQSFKDSIQPHYEAFPTEKYVGVLQFNRRLVMVKDLDLIKQIAVKDFDNFTDRIGTVDEKIDPLFGSNLLSLKGQKWRDMRATLSPAFTSSKMKNMFQLIADCGENMAQFCSKEMEKSENKNVGYLTIEMKDAFTRYTNDVIASAAFGIKVDSHFERENTFYRRAKEVSSFSGVVMFKFFLFNLFPKLSQMFGLKVFSGKLTNFFRTLVSDSMESRVDGKLYRPDMIQLLMEAKNGVLKHEHEVEAKEAEFATVEESALGKETVKRKWKDDDITAQAILFLVAGFDTSSTLLCFLTHELAINPDVQEKLQREIDKVAANNDGKINYTDLQNMKYLDMVVSEALRLWPPSIIVDRKCIRPYRLPPTSDNPEDQGYQLSVGEGIWIPIFGIQHDSKYFPNPYKFDPERFSDDNKGSIKNMTYIPFGIGPRNCIGSRFALMETKAVIFHLLAKFDVKVVSKTQIPIKLAINTLSMNAEKGFWVGLKPRIMKSS